MFPFAQQVVLLYPIGGEPLPAGKEVQGAAELSAWITEQRQT